MSATWFENNCFSAYHHSVDGIHPLCCTGSSKSWEDDFYDLDEAMELALAIRQQKEISRRPKLRSLSIANASPAIVAHQPSPPGFLSFSFSGVRYENGPFILTSFEVLRS